MGDVLLSVTLFSSPEAGSKQLCNAAMVKTTGTHRMDAVARALGRWAEVQHSHIALTLGGALPGGGAAGVVVRRCRRGGGGGGAGSRRMPMTHRREGGHASKNPW